MKNLLISTLSALTVSSLVTPVLANEVTVINRVNTNNINQITPFNLVHGSYQGRFTNQGISSNVSFVSRIRSQRLQAEDIVKGAIASDRLSEDTLQDTRYLNSVKFLLNDFGRH